MTMVDKSKVVCFGLPKYTKREAVRRPGRVDLSELQPWFAVVRRQQATLERMEQHVAEMQGQVKQTWARFEATNPQGWMNFGRSFSSCLLFGVLAKNDHYGSRQTWWNKCGDGYAK